MSEKKSKKKKQMVNKAKKIRSIVMMSLMCIMLLSAATYAWFSLSNSAKMTNLTMTVGAAKGLQIAEDTGGGAPDKESNVWKSSIPLEEAQMKGQLIPVTYENNKFYKPTYNDEGKVASATEETTDKLVYGGTNENKTGYYYEVTFYMMSKGDSSDICLVKGDSTNSKGTYIKNKNTSSTSTGAEAAIRIAITAGSTTTVVYEPNKNKKITENDNANTASGYTPKSYSTIKQNDNGAFLNDAGTTEIGNSTKLFTLAKDDPTLITLKIWIEGDDPQCCNDIALDVLEGQLQFEQMTSTTTTNG